jgi:serine/threonine-protein kinase
MGVKCTNCGTDNTQDSEFCKKCGTQLIGSEKKAIPTKTIEVPKEELTTGSTFADRYQIIEELGKGGMGRVYRVLDKELKEEVALKLIKPEIASDKKTLERFNNELRLSRKIIHKNVGRMYELMDHQGTRFITMEYVRGEDLRSSIRRFGQLPIAKSLSIAKQICEGLSEAHRLGVVHRDLKSSNIMIDKEGNVRIMDFGIARSLEEKGITGAGVMIGTPEYMSPEQVEGKEVDQRSDISSLGVILYEMVTGRVPFEGDTPFTIGMKHKGEMPQNPKALNTQISDDLNRVILRCLEKEKEKRYQSAGEVRSEIANVEKGVPTTEKVIPKRKAVTSKEITVTVRKPWMLIVSLAAVATLVVLGFLYFKGEKQGESPVPSPLERKMLVVLPFENLGSPEDEYLADGITDEITSRLAAVRDLRIISRTSAMQYKHKRPSLKQIGGDLGEELTAAGFASRRS